MRGDRRRRENGDRSSSGKRQGPGKMRRKEGFQRESWPEIARAWLAGRYADARARRWVEHAARALARTRDSACGHTRTLPLSEEREPGEAADKASSPLLARTAGRRTPNNKATGKQNARTAFCVPAFGRGYAVRVRALARTYRMRARAHRSMMVRTMTGQRPAACRKISCSQPVICSGALTLKNHLKN
jgi:hypothetical protein